MLLKVNILITGPPGSGKSTLISQAISLLKKKGLEVGGISTPDFRLASGRRGGFLIRDIATGSEQIMAATDHLSSIRVGRYGVNLTAIREVGVTAINHAIRSSDIIIIDEIGKMELAEPQFQQCVITALDSPKPVLGTIGLRLNLPFVMNIKDRQDVTVVFLSPHQRSKAYHLVSELLNIPLTL